VLNFWVAIAAIAFVAMGDVFTGFDVLSVISVFIGMLS
jgi:hypothetical protein